MFLLQALPLSAFLLSVLFAVLDCRNRKIPVFLAAVLAAAGFALIIVMKRSILSVLAAMVPGVMMLLLSAVSGGGIGPGDGVSFCIMAFLMNWKQTCILTAVSFLLAALVSLVIIAGSAVTGRSARGKTLPFLCFMPVGAALAFYLVQG